MSTAIADGGRKRLLVLSQPPRLVNDMTETELEEYAAAIADRIFEALTGIPASEWERSERG